MFKNSIYFKLLLVFGASFFAFNYFILAQTSQQDLNPTKTILEDHIDQSTESYQFQIHSILESLAKLEKEANSTSPELLPVYQKDQLPQGSLITSSFHLTSKKAVLNESLTVWSKGVIQIDADIEGLPIKGNNQNGQDLILKSNTAIVINGDIRLSDGGDGIAPLHSLVVRNQSTTSPHLSVSNSITTAFPGIVNSARINGGNGGTLFLQAPSIILNGKMVAGNGGDGVAGGEGGDGGSMLILSKYKLHSKYAAIASGNGGKGGDGSKANPFGLLDGGNGGNGGNTFVFFNGGGSGANGAAGDSGNPAGQDGGAGEACTFPDGNTGTAQGGDGGSRRKWFLQYHEWR